MVDGAAQHHDDDAHDQNVQHAELAQRARHGHHLRGLQPESRLVLAVQSGQPRHVAQHQHVQEGEQEHEDRKHDEADDVVHIAGARPAHERNHALPDAHVGPGFLGQAELVDDEGQQAARDGAVLDERVDVQAQRHAGQEQTKAKEDDPSDQKRNGKSTRSLCAHALDHKWGVVLTLHGLGLVLAIPLVLQCRRRRERYPQGGHGRADAEQGEAREPDVKPHHPGQRRRVVQAADEENHEDVGEHVGARPLGDQLKGHDAPACASNARGIAAILPQLAEHEHEDLGGGNDHGECDHERAAQPAARACEHAYEAEGALVGLLQGHAAVHRRDVEQK
mmetsp:Transcript_94421/g.294101  ORF Transcript_94421/g.294101 Transcript_94421/m.294101 type:complete len:335 (+) Transcript_94421:283-1287(+)